MEKYFSHFAFKRRIFQIIFAKTFMNMLQLEIKLLN